MGVVEEDNLTSQQRERHDSMHSTHKVEYFLESGGGGGGGPLLLAGELEKNKLKQSSEQFLVVVVAVVVYVASKFNKKKEYASIHSYVLYSCSREVKYIQLEYLMLPEFPLSFPSIQKENFIGRKSKVCNI